MVISAFDHSIPMPSDHKAILDHDAGATSTAHELELDNYKELFHSKSHNPVMSKYRNHGIGLIDLADSNIATIAENFICSPTYLATLTANVKTKHKPFMPYRESATPWRSAYTLQAISSWEHDLRMNGSDGIDEAEFGAQIAHLRGLAAIAGIKEKKDGRKGNIRKIEIESECGGELDYSASAEDETANVGAGTRQSRRKP